MNNEKDFDINDLHNTQFATSTYYHKPSMTEDELISRLEQNFAIHKQLMKRGYITSKEFLFITSSTFCEKMISELDYRYHGEKTFKEKEQAIGKCKIVEDYINRLNPKNHVKIAFASRSDNECALYDKNRFGCDEIREILSEAFA